MVKLKTVFNYFKTCFYCYKKWYGHNWSFPTAKNVMNISKIFTVIIFFFILFFYFKVYEFYISDKNIDNIKVIEKT